MATNDRIKGGMRLGINEQPDNPKPDVHPAPAAPAPTLVADLEFGSYVGEFGQEYRITCPNCRDRLIWWEAYNPRRANVCSCGIAWEAEVHACGRIL